MATRPPIDPALRRRYWVRSRRLTALLFACWLAITFGVVFFARELSGFSLFGWPFSYYMVAQGTTLLYLLLVGLHAWRMARLDRGLERDTAAIAQRNTDGR